MRRGLVFVLACAVGALLWVARTPPERPAALTQADREEPGPTPLAELASPPKLDEGTVDDAAQPASARHASRPGKAPPEALRAPVRGRVVVAETGDLIEGAFSLRLRTLDLRQSESLVTSASGTFASATRFPRARLLALLKDAEGLEIVDHEAPFDPASDEEWLVLVPDARWPTFVTGRVVDRRGKPLEDMEVSLVGGQPAGPFAEVPFAQDRTGSDGSFELDRLRAGSFRLHVQGAWSRKSIELVLRAGPNEFGDLVFDEPSGADVSVRLVVEDPAVRPDVWLALRETTSGRLRRFWSRGADQGEDGSYSVQLAKIPAGTYELTPLAFDGRTYEPARLVLSPPAAVEFRARGPASSGTVFTARDARTGEELLGFAVFGRLGRTWGLFEARQRVRDRNIMREELVGEVRLRPGFDSWVVCAAGHQAAAGRFAGAGETIEVALEPGWSELLQFEDAEGDTGGPRELASLQDPPVLAGVEVLVDGQPAGTSDENGFVLISRPREPEALTFRLPGWSVATESFLGDLHTVVMARTR